MFTTFHRIGRKRYDNAVHNDKRRHPNVKRLLCLVVTVLMALSMVSMPALADGSVSLRVLISSGSTEQVLREVAKDLEAQGIKLEIEAYDWNTYEGKQQLAATSKGGDYDVIFLPGNAVSTFANAGAIIDCSDVVAQVFPDQSDIYDSVKKFCMVDGKWYVSPYSAESMVYFYRTDLITKDELPKTIDEMYNLGVKLTKDGIFGLAIPGGPGEAACSFGSYFLWSYGGTYFNDKWEPQLNTPEAVAGFEMFAKIEQDCAPKGVTTWQNEETVAAFQSGSLAAMICWPGYYGMLVDPAQSKIADKVGIASVPAGPAGARPRFGAWGLGITANCKNIEAAKKVLVAYTCEENMKNRLLPVVTTASKKINTSEGAEKVNPAIVASSGTLDLADERPAIPELNLYIPAVGAAVNSIIAGQPAQETLDALNEEVHQIMEDGGYYN